MKEVKWGIIGVGDVTEVKSGPAFNKVPNSRIVNVMRRNLEKAKEYAERHGISKFTNNADELLKDDEINAIYSATPPSSLNIQLKLLMPVNMFMLKNPWQPHTANVWI